MDWGNPDQPAQIPPTPANPIQPAPIPPAPANPIQPAPIPPTIQQAQVPPSPTNPAQQSQAPKGRVPILPWIVAGVAILVAVATTALWLGAKSDADELKSKEAKRVAAVRASEEARPKLLEIAEETFSDSSDYDGNNDSLTVSVFFDTDDLGDYLSRLGFSSAVIDRMGQTRALDGTQEAEGDGVNATWTYHPDDGLQVVFEVED